MTYGWTLSRYLPLEIGLPVLGITALEAIL